MLTDVRDQVAEGTSLDEALARHPRVFGELTVSMVRAGSEGAFLEDALKRTADFLELQEELKGRIVGAMTYPAILAVAGFTVTVVLIVFFVPKFAELFARLEEQGGGLPDGHGLVLLWLSAIALARYGLFLAAGAGCTGRVGCGGGCATERGRLFVDRWKLKIPAGRARSFSDSPSRGSAACWARCCATACRCLRSLEISSDSAGNQVLAAAIRASAENISSGDTLSRAAGRLRADSPAGHGHDQRRRGIEQPGQRAGEHRRRHRPARPAGSLDVMVRLVEPLMLLVMGAVILFVLVALLLPVFDMSATVG